MALLVGLPGKVLQDGTGDFLSQHHPSWFSTLMYHVGDELVAKVHNKLISFSWGWTKHIQGIFLFIYILINDSISSSDYTALIP
jgi:hypothetical protein